MSSLTQASLILLAVSIAAAVYVHFSSKKNKKAHHS